MPALILVQQPKLGSFFWWLHAIAGECSTTDSFRVCYFCSPTSPQALHPWLPWHGPPDTAGWEWPPGIAPARWDSSAWTRLSWSPGSDPPSDWTRSSPRAPRRRPGRDSGGVNADITCEALSVIGQAPATWLATSLNRAEAIRPRRGSTTATCQVFIYMSDATTRAGNQNSVPLPPCLCPCHFTVGHAAFFFRVTGQRQWRLENTRNFLLLGRKKMLTTGCHRMRNGASVVERKGLEGALQRVHCEISPVHLYSKPPPLLMEWLWRCMIFFLMQNLRILYEKWPVCHMQL